MSRTKPSTLNTAADGKLPSKSKPTSRREASPAHKTQPTHRYRAIAELYDDEYASLDMLQSDVPMLMALLDGRRRDVLLPACGTGRIAIPLALAGHRVFGQDIDARVLSIARRKAGFAGLNDQRITFQRCDALRPAEVNRVDAVAMMFNSFLLFTTHREQSTLLTGFHRQLRPGGMLVLDVFNPDASLIHGRVVNADVTRFFSGALNASITRRTTVDDGPGPQTREVRFDYRWRSKGKSESARREFVLTYLHERELRLLLSHHGFVIKHLWGDYDQSAVSRESPRLIVVAERGRSG
jgi:SAM-dependent methyltransferase